ncbi:MAG: tRNA (adenosine(37)-N6)-threonylcarbamoyltransferase complex ATPase subunit type 1 TsaE [Gemmatimonadaceae bacterium]|nr:tRNA (adenosine(37)-N6)-threonylcarbamoyltransferase complex ATPase subunit type 1 TsaE [Gemmatimonadaceae bacterium]
MDANAPFLEALAATPPRASLAALTAWGIRLGRSLSAPVVITCSGDLGAGKTTLVRALCDGLGVIDLGAVTSPTFAVVHEYASRDHARVVHVDLYRIRRLSELETLGWDEIVATAPVLIVEWPEIAERTLPADCLRVSLEMDGANDDARRLTVQWRDTTVGWPQEIG